MTAEEFTSKMRELRRETEQKAESVLRQYRVEVFANSATIYADRNNNHPRFNLDVRFGFGLDFEDGFKFVINPSTWGEFDPSKLWSDYVAKYYRMVGMVVEHGAELREVFLDYCDKADALRKQRDAK